LRIAALAFGIVAGLVASLILALGGLDPATLGIADGRQESLLRFFLFVIANFGVLGAGIALAAPLVGAALLVVGAIAWVVASVLLHHGPDYVMLVPPVLLLIGTAFAVLAFVRRREPDYEPFDEDEDAIATQRAAMAMSRPAPRQAKANDDENEDDDEDANDRQGAVPVNATFFGDAGTATPLRGAIARSPEPQLRQAEPGDDRRANWEPVRRRTEPPRQKSVFRSPDDEYDDEESGLARAGRFGGSILTFGLYAALVAAGILIFLNLRANDSGRASATKIEASAPRTSASSSTAVAEAPTLTAPSAAPAATTAPVLGAPPTPASSASSLPVIAEASEPIIPASSSATPPANSFATAMPGLVVAGPDAGPPASSDSSEASQASADNSAAADAAGDSNDAVMPLPMPAAIAADRAAGPASPAKPVTAAPRTTRVPADAGI
jgi:hypothetical protein